MNQPNLIFRIVFFILAAAAAGNLAYAQTDDKFRPEPNCRITLQLLIGSGEPGSRNELPADLVDISNQLRKKFAFSSFRVANTFMGRVGNDGSFEYKSTANLFGQETETDAATFLEWSVGDLHIAPDGFQARAFRFGARVPVKTGVSRDEAGKISSAIGYESIGLNFARIGVPDHVPTLLGTLNLPRVNRMLFVVITIDKADR
jgi:hypothetical protein